MQHSPYDCPFAHMFSFWRLWIARYWQTAQMTTLTFSMQTGGYISDVQASFYNSVTKTKATTLAIPIKPVAVTAPTNLILDAPPDFNVVAVAAGGSK